MGSLGRTNRRRSFEGIADEPKGAVGEPDLRAGRACRLMFPLRSTVPLRYLPIATWALIAINCAVFLFEMSLSPTALAQFLSQFALIPARDLHPDAYVGMASPPVRYLPFFTNMFLHGGWLHLILNMWALWLFGPGVEDRLGRWSYVALYLACGVLASVTHAVFNSTSASPALGASGAIAGVLGCYIRLFPWARIVVLVPILFLPFFFDVPAVLFAGFWFLTQLLQGTISLMAPDAGGPIAWWAHVGGFIAGLVLAAPLQRRPPKYRRFYRDEGVLGFPPAGYG
jgi:membrane associated rhomboid family serine protease